MLRVCSKAREYAITSVDYLTLHGHIQKELPGYYGNIDALTKEELQTLREAEEKLLK